MEARQGQEGESVPAQARPGAVQGARPGSGGPGRRREAGGRWTGALSGYGAVLDRAATKQSFKGMCCP